ncbi:GAF and ANTAR domain-containing protein [Streptomyces xylophagus]|uniref:GAF and ANTAR domain-containing protein n=1 Tax=Streptomyces xylophagus TaxID=285514 RepID=UPI0005BB8114|nr:GAF and ANTAR domain-containing protein [Streptomyces xylophagus]
MISDGMAEVLRSLRLDAGGDPAQACARVLGAEGVALSLLVGADRTAEPLWCHPELSARFEELQFTLGEGPGPDAVRTGSPVLEPDLERVRPERWPVLLPAARDMGVQGVCGFPLGIGAIRVGVLTVLCDGDRRISEQQFTDATALAAVLTGAFLNGNGHVNGTAPGPDRMPAWPTGLNRPVVHQATGMISVQLGVSIQEALLRLRAHAYGSERPLGEVAEDVVARRLRFGGELDDDISGPYSPEGGKG